MQEFDFIETPENVALERPLAGIGSRFCAGVLDSLLIFGLLSLIVIAFFLVVPGHSLTEYAGGDVRAGWWALAFVLLAFFAVYWGYYVFFEMVTNGQSPGKKTLKVRVVKEGGGAITFTDIAIRNLLRAVDGLPVAYGVGGVCMFCTRRVQRLGDLAAGTVVVSEQVRDYSARTDKRARTEWEREATPEALRASGLSPQEYRVLHNYWLRRQELTAEARLRVLPKLLLPIFQRAGQPLPADSVEALEAHLWDLLARAEEAEQATGPAAPGPGGGV